MKIKKEEYINVLQEIKNLETGFKNEIHLNSIEISRANSIIQRYNNIGIKTNQDILEIRNTIKKLKKNNYMAYKALIRFKILKIKLYFDYLITLNSIIYYAYHFIKISLIFIFCIFLYYQLLISLSKILIIKNQFVITFFKSINKKILFHNFYAIYSVLSTFFGSIAIFQNVLKLNTFKNYNFGITINTSLFLSFILSLFLSIDTNNGDIQQIFFTLLLTIFPWSIFNKIFNFNKIESKEEFSKNLRELISEEENRMEEIHE